MTAEFAQGTVHTASMDLQAAVMANRDTLALWQSLTPLGRNEFICWVEDAKKPETRARRIEGLVAMLAKGVDRAEREGAARCNS